MSSTVVPFPKTQQLRTPLAQFFRVGEFHRQFGEMHAAGHLPTSRVVFESGRLKRQASLAKELKSEGVEITLDTGAAELSSKARHATFVRHSGWLGEASGRMLTPDDFRDTAMIERIALMAVEINADRVLAPTHFLGDRDFDDWLNVDAQACVLLREALDRLGGGRIRIDYPVIHSVQGLIDAKTKQGIAENLANLPVDGVWMRLSGLGKEPGPQKIRAFIRMLGGLHNLGKPVVLDYCAGLNGEAAEAFGVASGTAGGILELDQFNAGAWHKPPNQPDPEVGFSRARIVPLLGLGKGFRANDFEALASARGGRKLLLQSDYASAQSIQEMISNRRQMQARHLVGSQDALQAIPDLNRAAHFLSQTVSRAERRAKDISFLKPTEAQAKALKVDIDSLQKRTRDYASTMGKVADTLEKLHEERGSETARARVLDFNAVSQETKRDDQR